MKHLLLLACLLMPALASAQLPFAEGHYAGTLSIYTLGCDTAVSTVAMQLHIGPAGDSGRRAFTITYDSEQYGHDERNYFLAPKAGGPTGAYITDEDNGILLETYHVGPALLSRYAVGSFLMTITYTALPDGAIRFTVQVGATDPTGTTGDVPEGEIPLVTNYGISGYQEAVLYPVED